MSQARDGRDGLVPYRWAVIPGGGGLRAADAKGGTGRGQPSSRASERVYAGGPFGFPQVPGKIDNRGAIFIIANAVLLYSQLVDEHRIEKYR